MSGRRIVASAALALGLVVAACAKEGTPAPTPLASSTTTTSEAAAPAFRSHTESVTAEELAASWHPGCPVAVEDLQALDVSFWGFDGKVHEGRLIVARDQAADLAAVFRDLFDARYPIHKMAPVDRYGGSDAASVDADNTSAFNCRLATGGTGWSEHAYGRAVDLNPLENPYVRGATVLPPQSAALLDRTRDDQGLIRDGDPAVVAFAKVGWPWGGHWRTTKDYQHFSATGR